MIDNFLKRFCDVGSNVVFTDPRLKNYRFKKEERYYNFVLRRKLSLNILLGVQMNTSLSPTEVTKSTVKKLKNKCENEM